MEDIVKYNVGVESRYTRRGFEGGKGRGRVGVHINGIRKF